MQRFDHVAAQGDVMLVRVDGLPATAVPDEPEGDRYILAHSETGHHHVVERRTGVRLYRDPRDAFCAFLVVDGGPVLLEHRRPTDPHDALEITPGVYEVRRQREYGPSGWRRVED